MGRRTVLLIASIVVAAVGTALIFLYVRGADDRANQKTELVSVVVATQDIKQGTPIKDLGSAFKLRGIPQGALPDTGYYSGPRGLSTLVGRGQDAAMVNLAKGSIIVSSDFAGADAAASAGLRNGQVEVSIQITDPDRVAGLLTPGAKVAVIATSDAASAKELGFAGKNSAGQVVGADQQISITTALMSSITVLRVGSTGQGNDSTAEQVDPKIIALAVTPAQALLLRAGEKVAELSLAILSPGAVFPTGHLPQIVAIGGGS